MFKKPLNFIMMLLLLLMAVVPSATKAADWKFSTHSAQMTQAADGDAADPASSDEVVPSIPGKKKVGQGVLFSLIIPGTGQLYGGSWLRAIPWFAIEVAGWAIFAKYHSDGLDKTDQFEAYAGTRDAGNNFNVNAYMLREYQVAINTNYNPEGAYTGTLEQWRSEPWNVRQDYLQAPYGHDVMTSDIQQYYEMIGKYFDQFGYGWIDTYDPASANLNDGSASNVIWYSPSQGGDEPATIQFDGTSPLFFAYRDMRGEANDLLNKGNVAMEVVLVNHILSALDAALVVRSHNKKLESEPMGDLKLHYDAKTINGETARFLTLSMPLSK